MNHDPLRDRIGRLDPTLDDAGIEPVSSAAMRSLLEDTMNTPLDTHDHDHGDDHNHDHGNHDHAGHDHGGHRHDARRTDRRWPLLAGAAAVVALAIGGAALAGVFDSGDANDVAAPAVTSGVPDATTPPDKLKVLELSSGDTDPVMMSCLVPSAEFLADMPVAFAATVDAVEGDIVTMTVDRWYTGGDAQKITLTATLGMEALIGGIPFEAGQQYLVSATNGVVNYCGFSGPVSPELQTMYDQAFPDA